tara:strand:- start:1459 stop:2505 length:1047 start_codon:yes stop_codon:yes gene_type:complete
MATSKWTREQNQRSNIQIKNVAVCMYGQYRTGDVCIESIKQFYAMEGINVDFFCSLKEYETTYTREVYNKEKYNYEYARDQQHLTEDAVVYQTKQIHEHYKPKKFKVYTTDYENKLKDIRKSILQSKVLAGWVEAVMLKQQYEVEADITYDLVVMQRYDVLVWPKHAFRTIVKSLTDMPINNRHTFNTANKNLILYQPIEIIRRYNGTLMYPNGQDLWVMGVGNALDVWVYDALEYIPSRHSSNFSIHKFSNGYPQIDTHEMIASVSAKMNIPSSMFPMMPKYLPDIYNHVLSINPRHLNEPMCSVAPFPVREVYWPDGIIPQLEKLTNEELEKEYDKHIFPGWSSGL